MMLFRKNKNKKLEELQRLTKELKELKDDFNKCGYELKPFNSIFNIHNPALAEDKCKKFAKYLTFVLYYGGKIDPNTMREFEKFTHGYRTSEWLREFAHYLLKVADYEDNYKSKYDKINSLEFKVNKLKEELEIM